MYDPETIRILDILEPYIEIIEKIERTVFNLKDENGKIELGEPDSNFVNPLFADVTASDIQLIIKLLDYIVINVYDIDEKDIYKAMDVLNKLKMD